MKKITTTITPYLEPRIVSGLYQRGAKAIITFEVKSAQGIPQKIVEAIADDEQLRPVLNAITMHESDGTILGTICVQDIQWFTGEVTEHTFNEVLKSAYPKTDIVLATIIVRPHHAIEVKAAIQDSQNETCGMTVTEVLCFNDNLVSSVVASYAQVRRQTSLQEKEKPAKTAFEFVELILQKLFAKRQSENNGPEQLSCPARLKIESVLSIKDAVRVAQRVYPIVFAEQFPEAFYFSKIETVVRVRTEERAITALR